MNIVYAVKRIRGQGLLMKRWLMRRRPLNNKVRFFKNVHKLRKKWWHFRTRWEKNNEEV